MTSDREQQRKVVEREPSDAMVRAGLKRAIWHLGKNVAYNTVNDILLAAFDAAPDLAPAAPAAEHKEQRGALAPTVREGMPVEPRRESPEPYTIFYLPRAQYAGDQPAVWLSEWRKMRAWGEAWRTYAQQQDGAALRLVAAQAEDAGLWFVAQTAPEAYLQDALRKLHAAVEHQSRGEPDA